MIKPTMPRTGSYAPSAPRGSSSVHRRAMGTALRMDLAMLTGNSPVATAVQFLAPLVFSGFMQDSADRGGAAVSIAMAAFWTMLWWSLSIGGFFVVNGADQASQRMSGVIPVSRRTQVRARYLSALSLFLIGLLELGVEIAIGVAAFGMAFDGVVVVPYAVAAAALVDAVLIPVFYSCDFAVAYRRLMLGGSVLFFGAVLLLEMLPKGAKEWLFGIDPTLPSAAGIAVVIVVAVYASYRLSVRIWSRREL